MKRCLVVEDSDVIRKIARRILESLGFDVAEAATGQAGLDFCAKSPPDLILLDWQLPDMGGIEFANLLRKQDRGSVPAVIYCTTENDPADIARALAAGAGDYLLKPYDRGAIAALLSAAA
jgi:two-component system, chemotaxis family, chemotaxis protein CheY